MNHNLRTHKHINLYNFVPFLLHIIIIITTSCCIYDDLCIRSTNSKVNDKVHFSINILQLTEFLKNLFLCLNNFVFTSMNIIKRTAGFFSLSLSPSLPPSLSLSHTHVHSVAYVAGLLTGSLTCLHTNNTCIHYLFNISSLY